MGIHVSSLQHLLDEIVDIGALAVVLADSSGLVIVNSLGKSDSDDLLSDSLGALSSIVIPQGEQVAGYLANEGSFEDTVIHTNSSDGPRSVLAFTIESDPKTCLMIISKPELEGQITHELSILKEKIILAIKGMAVEVRDLDPKISGGDKKVKAFWNMLESKVINSNGHEELKRNILDAKEDFLVISGSYSTIIYSMNAAANRINSLNNIDSIKENIINDIKSWRKKSGIDIDEDVEEKIEPSEGVEEKVEPSEETE